MQILETVVNEFKLHATNPRIKEKIRFAKNVAFANSQEEADQLRLGYGV